MSLTPHIPSAFRHYWWTCTLSLLLVLLACTNVDDPTAAPTSPALSAVSEATRTLEPSPTTRPSTRTPGLRLGSQAAPGLPSDLIPPADGMLAEGELIEEGSIAPPPDRDLFQLAAQLKLKSDPASIPRVVNQAPVSYETGRQDTFWLVNFRNLSVYQSAFELRLVTPHAYWYVERGQRVLNFDLERAAAEFEENIYPRVTAAFGQEWVPGVDNDPHLNIIHAQIEGVAGYFSSSDEHPQSVYPYSNQRETIYINTRTLGVGSPSYLEVLAHELQHAIHWNNDNNEDTWVNEGLSDVAVSVAGYHAANIDRFLRSPTISLVHWPLDNFNIFAHYGGSALFFHYLSEHYSDGGDLRPLVQDPADGIAGIESYLNSRGFDVTFREVFSDWVLANILDEPGGLYGYSELDVEASVTRKINGNSELKSVLPQYATEYVELTSLTGPVRLKFKGVPETVLLPTKVGPDGCWWSNSGDSITSTLSYRLDLRGHSRASLNYEAWYEVEQDWDYAYVQVSTDQGRTWDILETPAMSPENPIGNGFGPGYTGESGGWITESLDLSAYAGRQVQVRFQYVTDDAVNGSGLCFRNISVPEVGLTSDDQVWQPDGFVKLNNRVKQDYIVQVIKMDGDNQVSAIKLDRNNSGEVVIEAPESLDRLVVAVSALAPLTLQLAPYTLTVESAR